MHDTFLNERIYESLLKLCQENRIIKLNKANIAVNIDSHISENSLQELFNERKNDLIGEWTEIVVEKEEVGKLNAIIKSIEGVTLDE